MEIFDTVILVRIFSDLKAKALSKEKISMMWPSQNFLLYNGTIIKIKVNERINNLKKYVTSVPPPLGMCPGGDTPPLRGEYCPHICKNYI